MGSCETQGRGREKERERKEKEEEEGGLEGGRKEGGGDRERRRGKKRDIEFLANKTSSKKSLMDYRCFY